MMKHITLVFCGLFLIGAAVSSVRAGTVQYTYDAAGRLTAADYGGGRTILYTYDANGNLLERKVTGQTPNPVPDIKANGSDGPVTVSPSQSVAVTISLDPGEFGGYNADWWVAVQTPFSPPGNWYSYVYPTGWKTGINLCVQTPLFQLGSTQVLNMTLPVGQYTFYFALDEPTGQPEVRVFDAVEVQVEQ